MITVSLRERPDGDVMVTLETSDWLADMFELTRQVRNTLRSGLTQLKSQRKSDKMLIFIMVQMVYKKINK